MDFRNDWFFLKSLLPSWTSLWSGTTLMSSLSKWNNPRSFANLKRLFPQWKSPNFHHCATLMVSSTLWFWHFRWCSFNCRESSAESWSRFVSVCPVCVFDTSAAKDCSVWRTDCNSFRSVKLLSYQQNRMGSSK